MGLGLSLAGRHADGREIPVDISLSPLEVGGRRLVGAVLRDLRGRAEGPDALRIQATALRSAANGIVITDRTGTIVWVNPAACAITGYAPDELVGAHTRLLKSGEHSPDFYPDLWQSVTNSETWSGTIVNRRKDGTLYHEEQTIAPVQDAGGKVTHFVAIKADVSARRQAEEALSAAHRELAARVAEIESLNERLRERAIRDPLTGLHNRRYFEETAGRDAARAVRTGGDEFVVLLPGAAMAAARERAEAVRSEFAAAPINLRDEAEIRSPVSVGVTVSHRQGESHEAALGRADVALYEAKRAGRNRVVAAAAKSPA